MANDDEPEDFAALLAEYEQKSGPSRRKQGPQIGDLVRGAVVSIGADAVFVDLGGKADGVLELEELRDADGRVTVKVGDEIEARVVEIESGVHLKRVMGRGAEAAGELAQAFEHQIPVEGLVTGVNKGGVEVQVAGTRGFCPISQLDVRHVEDAGAYIGQRLQFRVTRLGRDVVLSRRALLEEAAQGKAAETRARLEVGAIIKGTVTAIKDYGAFVDLGGLEGMLHVSQLGFARVEHPKDVLAVGQVIDVQVIKIEKSDDPRRPEKIALSLKSLERDPWLDAIERFPEGAHIPGKVVRVETFGAIVELAAGVDGLVHVSELGAGRPLKHAREAVKLGQAVRVTVLAVDRERRRISLALADPGDDDAPPPTAGGPQKLGTFADLLQRGKKR
ncbi:MAG TPA: S1 RNA-binding domain-containing protein [Polyangia bacterium]|nr:S1 RNA-binding domain-containing protein [Polyangia bacterium]